MLEIDEGKETRVVLNGEIENSSISVKNYHRICIYKYFWAVAQTHQQQKREDSFITSLLFLFVC